MNQLREITSNFLASIDQHIAKEAKRKLSKVLPVITHTQEGKRYTHVHVCPVPGCKNNAHLAKDEGGTWFMACEAHKNLGYRKITQYRKARKLSKQLGLPVGRLLKDWDKYRKHYDRKFKN